MAFRRHTLLPLEEGDKPERKRFSRYPIGYFHIDIAELRTAEGKLHRFIAIDRTSSSPSPSWWNAPTRKERKHSWTTWLQPSPARFIRCCRNRGGATARLRGHLFDRACWRHGIKHRLTKPNHPWTNAQAERLNRTVEEATVKRFHYESHARLRSHEAVTCTLAKYR